MSAKWDNHFLNLALAHAEMSKDPNTQVGAVIVGPDREIRSAGFNGLPRGIADTAERLGDRETKLRLIVHAEMNAVLAAARVGIPLLGCSMFIACTDDTGAVWGGPPCVRCTVEIIQSGITRIVARPMKPVSKWAADLALAQDLLAEAGIEFSECPSGQR